MINMHIMRENVDINIVGLRPKLSKIRETRKRQISWGRDEIALHYQYELREEANHRIPC